MISTSTQHLHIHTSSQLTPLRNSRAALCVPARAIWPLRVHNSIMRDFLKYFQFSKSHSSNNFLHFQLILNFFKFFSFLRSRVAEKTRLDTRRFRNYEFALRRLRCDPWRDAVHSGPGSDFLQTEIATDAVSTNSTTSATNKVATATSAAAATNKQRPNHMQ